MRPTLMLRALAALAATLAAACTPARGSVACDSLAAGDADSAVVLLADGRSKPLERVVRSLVTDPSSVFGAPATGLGADPGIVSLVTYDARGEVTEIGRFNLAGVGHGSTRRAANARAQARCLEGALDRLAAPPPGGNLIRALPPAMVLAEAAAPRAGVVVFGLPRWSGDGFFAWKTDLGSPAARTHVVGELARLDLLPDLSLADTPVVFLAPGDGIDSGVAAAGLEAFASELCAATAAPRCTTAELLG